MRQALRGAASALCCLETTHPPLQETPEVTEGQSTAGFGGTVCPLEAQAWQPCCCSSRPRKRLEGGPGKHPACLPVQWLLRRP